jgi:hypothetical protein
MFNKPYLTQVYPYCTKNLFRFIVYLSNLGYIPYYIFHTIFLLLNFFLPSTKTFLIFLFFCKGKRLTRTSKLSLEPTSPLFNGYRGSFFGQSGRGVVLTTHLHPAPRLRTRGATPLLLYTPLHHEQRQLHVFSSTIFIYLLHN